MLPALFAFVLSFTVIAAFWVGHYRTFRYVVDADGRLVAINFAFLFCIAILPFPTSIIARQGDLPSATIIYAAFGVATGALSTLLWVYPSQIAHLVVADRDAVDRALRHLPGGRHPDRVRAVDPGRRSSRRRWPGSCGSRPPRSRRSSPAGTR